MTEFSGNVTGDLRAVETPVFYEDLVGMHARNDHSGQVNT
jgi:hypothetical protein